ncbi:F-box protein At2g21930-like [Rutidosis leptorrhynchoides]|uniref:F-box protein At2g21930-like n=1 Tax=Rutidosis leptorrhynchoides TaxID=125765 RepID=UPI003A9A492C
MSIDYIPFDIQTEILKRLGVKSLIRFRSVSKAWKSLIDSPKFVASYGIDRIQTHHILIPYLRVPTFMYMSFVDHDDTFLFDQTNVRVLPTEHNICGVRILGSSHGLFCLDCDTKCDGVYFGVCPVTRDPKLVRITICDLKWLVDIYTVSSGSWRKITNNLPRGTIEDCSDNVVTDKIIYLYAVDTTIDTKVIVAFDLTSEEFTIIGIPNHITHLKIFKLRDTLVFHEYDKLVCEVWMLNNDVSKTFTKLYKITTSFLYKVKGFTNSGTPIIEKMGADYLPDGLYVYEPNSECVTKIVIEEAGYELERYGYDVYTYHETLLLLDR